MITVKDTTKFEHLPVRSGSTDGNVDRFMYHDQICGNSSTKSSDVFYVLRTKEPKIRKDYLCAKNKPYTLLLYALHLNLACIRIGAFTSIKAVRAQIDGCRNYHVLQCCDCGINQLHYTSSSLYRMNMYPRYTLSILVNPYAIRNGKTIEELIDF